MSAKSFDKYVMITEREYSNLQRLAKQQQTTAANKPLTGNTQPLPGIIEGDRNRQQVKAADESVDEEEGDAVYKDELVDSVWKQKWVQV